MQKLFIVGKYIEQKPNGAVWEFVGVFDKQDLAETACIDKNYFIGPAPLNGSADPGGAIWPECYYINSKVFDKNT